MKKIFVLILFYNFAFAQKKPNILFIIADDAGIEMSAYGCTYAKTPAFDKIAKEGLLFERAYTPNAKCAPSRATLLTGRNPWQLDEAMNHNIYFPPRFKTFPEVLKDNNYHVGLIGKGYGPGKMLNFNGSVRNVFTKSYDEKTTTPPTKFISGNDYTANFKEFIKDNPTDKPWFCWIGIAEPHRFFEYGSGIKNGKKTSDIQRVPSYFPDSDTVRNDLLDYALEIEYMDKHIDQIYKHLEETGQLDNTLIIVTSDHGMPFPRVKGNQYENANHIPFAMRFGKNVNSAGRRVLDYINFTDIAPTILEVAGIEQSKAGMYPITGKSLTSIMKSNKNGQVEANRDFVLVGQERHDIGRPNDEGYPIRGLHKNGFLYLKNYETSRYPVCNPETGYLNTDGGATKSFILNQRRNKTTKTYWNMAFGFRPAEEFYDVKNDPDCVKNLINDPKYKDQIANIKKEMESKLTAQGDLRMMGLGYIYEKFPTVENVNFYERYFKGEKLNTGWVNPSDYEKEPIKD
jgi:N-sulfoglucosamine sulfohydrolase